MQASAEDSDEPLSRVKLSDEGGSGAILLIPLIL